MKVKVIKKRGKAALVEFNHDGKLCRVTVPTEEVHGRQVSQENLAKGIVYGEPWQELSLAWPTAEEIAKSLHANGIWTKKDLLSNMPTVRGIVTRITANIVKSLRNMARE